MKNPFAKNDLFATPDSMESLQEWLMSLNGNERIVAMTAAGMTWNLSAEIFEKEVDKEVN